MTTNTLKDAQECLTQIRDNKRRKIIDIESLLRSHDTPLVLNFLMDLSKEHEKHLKNLVIKNKSSVKIDEIVSKMFRIYMAIRAIEREDEEVMAA
jgi:hypothetical protein